MSNHTDLYLNPFLSVLSHITPIGVFTLFLSRDFYRILRYWNGNG